MKKFILILFLLLIYASLIKTEEKSPEISRNIYEIYKDTEFTFSIDPSLNKDQKHGLRITIYMQYNGDEPCDIVWDEDFGRLLWAGAFLLEIKSETAKSDTKNLQRMTGGLFYPSSTYRIYKGSILTSILDFTRYPMSLMGLPKAKGKISLIFYIRDKEGVLKRIGNELVIDSD